MKSCHFLQIDGHREIILSGKTNTNWIHFYMGSEKQNNQTRNRLTDIENRLVEYRLANGWNILKGKRISWECLLSWWAWWLYGYIYMWKFNELHSKTFALYSMYLNSRKVLVKGHSKHWTQCTVPSFIQTKSPGLWINLRMGTLAS